MADERDPRNRFRNEEAEEEENEEEYEEVESNGRGALVGFLILFIILFLVSTGLLFYYQFYQGDGWHFTLKKDNISQTEVNNLREKNDKLKSRTDSLKTQLESKTQKVQDLKTESGSQSQSTQQGGAVISGTYFEVQIGAFNSFSFERYGDQVTNLVFHNEGGMKKLALGRFKEKNAARAFRRDLSGMGLEDAFIVKKKDGRRIQIIESY